MQKKGIRLSFMTSWTLIPDVYSLNRSRSESQKGCRHVCLTFQTGRVELNEEFGPARRLHDGLDALKLYVGLL